MIEKKYQDREKSIGWVVSRVVNGPSIPDLPFDLFDISHNPGEQNAVFIPTRILVATGQVLTRARSSENR